MKRATPPTKAKKRERFQTGGARVNGKRTCSECGQSLEKRRPQALTCSGQCRTARQRRLAK